MTINPEFASVLVVLGRITIFAIGAMWIFAMLHPRSAKKKITDFLHYLSESKSCVAAALRFIILGGTIGYAVIRLIEILVTIKKQ